ncbi:hypothetical protein ACHQM5_000359 [Ranunculus cassubicifolius]
MKTGKTPKTDNICSKRPRPEHGQGYNSKVIFGDFSALTGYSNSSPKESTISERSPGVGRKHSLDGRRGDKRHFKQPTKSKLDPFFSKGSPNSSPSTGGGSILGMYGLKSDTHDVTKHIEDLSLNDLLDGSYKYPCLSKDKSKKTAATNENLFLAIKSACSILKPLKSPQPIVADLNNCSTSKVDTGIFGSDSSQASGTEPGKGDNVMENLVQNKKTCIETTTSQLCEPKNILERLSLPQAKSLDTLLAETSNKSALSRSMINDFRSSKPMPYGSSLPPFPWSHCSNGHGSSKAGIDTTKICSNRSKWVQIGSLVNSNGGDGPNFDLSSLNFDHESTCVKGPDASLTKCSSSCDSQLKLELCVENQPTKGSKSETEHSPRLLAGAQLLYEIARHSDENQSNGQITWPKKPSQKSMKARKPRTSGKLDDTSSIPRSVSRPNDSFEKMDKKPRYLSPNSKKMDIRHTNHIGRGTIKWSVPTSSRSSPNGEGKLSHSKSDSVRLGYKRPLDRPSGSELRKVVSMDWGRGKSKNGS